MRKERKMINTYQILKKVLQENFGVFVFGDEQEDFSISDYVSDSISFIQFITAIEEELGSELSDDFLDLELLSSAKGFLEKLDFYIETLQHDNHIASYDQLQK